MNEEQLINLESTFLPSKTYHVQNDRITGHIDGRDAVVQAVDKLLRTERFEYVIYSADYGVELERLIGQSFDFVKSDLERTIQDALVVDDRIDSISDFEMEQTKKDTLTCRFKVNTVEGSFNNAVEVTV